MANPETPRIEIHPDGRTVAELIRLASHALADGRDEEAAELLVKAFPPPHSTLCALCEAPGVYTVDDVTYCAACAREEEVLL